MCFLSLFFCDQPLIKHWHLNLANIQIYNTSNTLHSRIISTCAQHEHETRKINGRIELASKSRFFLVHVCVCCRPNKSLEVIIRFVNRDVNRIPISVCVVHLHNIYRVLFRCMSRAIYLYTNSIIRRSSRFVCRILQCGNFLLKRKRRCIDGTA